MERPDGGLLSFAHYASYPIDLRKTHGHSISLKTKGLGLSVRFAKINRDRHGLGVWGVCGLISSQEAPAARPLAVKQSHRESASIGTILPGFPFRFLLSCLKCAVGLPLSAGIADQRPYRPSRTVSWLQLFKTKGGLRPPWLITSNPTSLLNWRTAEGLCPPVRLPRIKVPQPGPEAWKRPAGKPHRANGQPLVRTG